MKTYICSYNYQGSEWGFELKAENIVDAKKRLRAIGFGRVDGEIKAKIEVPDLWGWFKRLAGRA